MSEPGNNCPNELKSYKFKNINYPLGESHNSSSGSVFSLIVGLRYSRVRGRVKRYQYSGVDGIYQNHFSNINGGCSSFEWLDGVSITHGMNFSCQYIWTFIVGQSENQNSWEDC